MSTNNLVEIDELYGQLSSGDDNWHWYVIYTKPRREKKLAQYAKDNLISYYLPIIESERVYKYRKVRFTKPLFPGYIFVKCTLKEKQTLLVSGHIVRFLRVPDEIYFLNELKQILNGKLKGALLQKTDYLEEGIAVQIKSGSFRGLTGVVKSIENANQIILRVSLLRQAVAVKVKRSQLEIIKEH